MPHQSFGTVRQGVDREPITFDFGVYGEETFTVIPDPSLGDTFDLYDAPEPSPENMLETVRVLARFIKRMLAPEDRPRFDEALKRIPSTQAFILVDVATYIAGQVTGFPTRPSTISSGGRRPGGTGSRKGSAGTGRSRR